MPLPKGYIYYELEGRKLIRRLEANNKEFQRLGVSDEGKIVLGEGRSARISKPGEVTRNLGPARGGYNRHHLVPDAVVRRHPLTQAARERGKPQYNLDEASNLIYLPATEEAKKASPDLPMHSGSHPRWNARTTELLRTEQAILVRQFGSLEATGIEKELTESVKAVERQLRRDIKNWKVMR